MRHTPIERMDVPGDTDLVEAARTGDASALGALLERHRPRLFAAALRILGYGDDAEDAVHETWLIALRHLPRLRTPESVGGWLHAVLRHECLRRLRRGRMGRELGRELFAEREPPLAPDEHLEQLETREWVSAALQRLPETLRVTTMLRYFGRYDSYDELAAILGVPIGTVRSRLAEARRKLAGALRETADRANGDDAARAGMLGRFWEEAFDDLTHRGDRDRFLSHFAPELALRWSDGRLVQGRMHLAAEIDGDLALGVRLEPQRIIATRGVTVIEGRFANPTHAPDHCPPAFALVVFGGDGPASRMHLHLSQRPAPAER